MTRPFTSPAQQPPFKAATVILAIAVLAGCATPEGMLNDPLLRGSTAAQEVAKVKGFVTGSYESTATNNVANLGNALEAAAPPGVRPAAAPAAPPTVAASGAQFFQTPPMGPPGRSVANVSRDTSSATSSLAGEAAELAVNFDSLPLGQFAQTVFGTVLKRGVSIDAAVMQRRDLVNLRTPKPQTPQQLFELARAVLRSYQVTVQDIGGLIRVVPDSAQTGYLPEIRRGRAMPEVPQSLRPVFYLAELEYTTPGNITQWTRVIFAGKVQMSEDPGRNAILLSGQQEDVNAALEAIAVLDQPNMRGRTSARIVPTFWAAEELARRLTDVLSAEGVSVGVGAASQAAVLLLPIPALNSVIVFAAGDQALNRTLRWAKELDQPNTARSAGGFFTYPVRNTDAADLAKTLGEIMNNAAGAPGAPKTTKVVVNAATNTLVFQGSANDYQQWFSLLQELDRPAKTAMITVTVAEVRLDDTEQLGFEWLLKEFTRGGYRVNVLNQTFGALGGTAPLNGLSARINGANGDPRAVLQLLSSVNKVRVLSNPTVVARNGESATIQVGDEVPIITSQQSNANTGASTGGVQQTIQYRNTGVLLTVKPVIHAGGRIDLDISQEVSNAARNQLGGTASPTISTRRVQTKMSMMDGSTVLMAGLMERRQSGGETGIPYVKDIPLAGNLFKTTSESTVRTELVVLVTPYIMADDFEAEVMTNAFRSQFKWATSEAMGKGSAADSPLSAGSVNKLRDAGRQAADAAQTGVAQPAATQQSVPYILPALDAGKASTAQPPVAPARQDSSQGLPVPSASPSAAPQSGAATVKPSSSAGPAGSNLPAGAVKPGASNPLSPKAGSTPPNKATTPPAKPISGTTPVTDPAVLRELMDAVNKGK